jgi:hypothetical protein
VDRALAADDPVGPGARARQDEVVAGQVERLDGGRIEGQEHPEGARGGAQALQEGGVDGPVGEPALRALLVVYRREDVGVRPQLGDGQEDPLRSAHVEQEVVDKGNFRLLSRT